MKKTKTVKRRIFTNNAWMLLVTLLAFAVINLGIAKIYVETLEKKWSSSVEQLLTQDQMEDFVMDWTVQQKEFLLLAVIDILLCLAALALISSLFARRLSEGIQRPLYALSDGAERVRKGILTEKIPAQEDVEFDSTCRTFNEMQDSLRTEKQKNEQYEKARTDMIAGISHDLRTPLTAAKGSVQAVLDGVASTPEQQERFLRAAGKRLGDMEQLLEQLLYLSRMETGNLPIALQTMDICVFVKEYVQEKAGRKDMQCSAVVPDAPLVVQADPVQLLRILDNIAENSVKYSGKDPAELIFTVEELPEEICIRVADTGVGVSEDKLGQIFEEFYRDDLSRNKREGNGLGLYIVKYLIEAMQGRVRAENADGLTICLHLPVYDGKKE